MALTKLTDLQPIHVHSIGISTFDGSVSVGGTLTYEDVTNVDAIGIVTARTGIKVLGGGANVVGVVTATAFHGDGSNLTGISGVSIANQADNRLITATGTTDALNAESTLTYDGADLNISNNTPQLILTDTNSNNSYGRVRGNGGNLILSADHTNATGGTRIINFEIGGSEKARITSDGRLGIGTNVPQRPLAVTSGTSGVTAEFNVPDNNPTGSGAGLSLNVVNRSNSGYAPLSFNATLYTFGDERNGTVSLIIGVVAGVAGSYFRYVSKQTVRTTKK